jgi:hypothetical protein
VTHSSDTVTVLGKDHAALRIQAEYQGVSIDEILCMVRKGSYLSTITITDMTGSPADEALDYFQTID